MNRAVFLDRDGVINRNLPNLVSEKQFELVSDSVPAAVKRAKEAGYRVIIITNQPVIAKGFCTREDVERIHEHMKSILAAKGARIDAIYVCPHHPEKGFAGEVKALKIDCDCRKPKPGLILQAAKEHQIDLGNSWMIGDSVVDVAAGKAAGVRTILLAGSENGSKDEKRITAVPDFQAIDINEAVSIVLNNHT